MTDFFANSSNFVIILSFLGIISFILLFITSFVKIAIVLGILRSALGTPQLPPTTVITGLAIILSIYIMAPVFHEAYEKGKPSFESFIDKNATPQSKVSSLFAMVKSGSAPFRRFLSKHTHEEEKANFSHMSKEINPKSDGYGKEDFIVLIPGFLLSEITEAFQIGFLLFLPFLIIDLLSANILMALGMHMVSPTTVSLPFKLLLFVSVNGFSLLSHALVRSYIVI